MMYLFLFQALAALSAIILPAEATQLRGHASAAEFQTSCDSLTVDLTWVTTEGFETQWRYFLSDTAIIEDRGWQWRRYNIASDSLILNHIETSHERSDFAIAIPPGIVSTTASPFNAHGRRDMAFVYSDTGTVSTASFSPRTLILSMADTLRGCRLDSVGRVYRRTLAPADTSIATITESELTWRDRTNLAPLATTTIRTIHADGRQPVSEFYTAVFPPSLNFENTTEHDTPQTQLRSVNSYSNPQRNASHSSNKNVDPQAPGRDPELAVKGRQLTASASGPVSVSVCDIAGRIWIAEHGVDCISADLSDLPAGEYVITVTCGEKHVSKTIMFGL